jgi:predicted nuclease of predicted toxin-antitoxin system
MAWVDSAVLAADNPASPKEVQEILRYVARKAKPRFYADENFPAQAVALLRRMGGRVETVQEARRSGHPDENHAAYALRNGLVLLTCDRDFLDNKRFPLMHCPAIYVFAFGQGTIQELRAAFRCLASVFDVPQLFDKWCKIDAGTESWTELVRFRNGSILRTRFRFGRRGIEEWVDAAD